MRDIRFRGKNINTGKWVYGYFKKNTYGDCYIEDEHGLSTVVLSDTVGQYVCKDANGNDVYEGDIVRYEYDSRYAETGKIAKHVIERYRVVYSPSSFTFLICPLVKEEGIIMNANYIEELNMVKEKE